MEAPGTHSQAAATVGLSSLIGVVCSWHKVVLVEVSSEGRLRVGPACCLSENSLKLADPSSPCVQMFIRKLIDSHCPYIPPLSLSPPACGVLESRL